MLYELKNVTKTYKVNDSINHAIDNISLDIEKGEVIVILGPSGSGKSTMLNLLSGIDTPTKGKIYFDDVLIMEDGRFILPELENLNPEKLI